MSHPNAELIRRFYRAFQQLDAEGMAACYADDVRFSDPVFQNLRGGEAADMWRMLAVRAQDFSLTFDQEIPAAVTRSPTRWPTGSSWSK